MKIIAQKVIDLHILDLISKMHKSTHEHTSNMNKLLMYINEHKLTKQHAKKADN